MAKNQNCQCNAHRFQHWSPGKTPHALEQPSPSTTTTEAQELCSLHSRTREATTGSPCTATKSSLHLPQLEKAHAKQRDSAQPKINTRIKKFLTSPGDQTGNNPGSHLFYPQSHPHSSFQMQVRSKLQLRLYPHETRPPSARCAGGLHKDRFADPAVT